MPTTRQIEDLLVIVPGILGSRLRHVEHGVVWGGAKTPATLLRPMRALRLGGDGRQADPKVQPDGLIELPLQLPGLSKIDAYTGLLKALRRDFALDDSNLLEFAYDWRLSCAFNARRLGEEVEARRNGRKVVFVAHSMGGLVVQHYTDVLGGGEHTKRVITVGTPFRGAAKALGAMAPAEGSPLSGVRDRIAEVVRTLPSVYELLPTYRAIVSLEGKRAMTAGDLPAAASTDLYAAAADFHAQGEAGDSAAYRRSVLIGSLQPTVQFASISAGQISLHQAWNDTDERGDGTVPRQSVAPPGWVDDADAEPFAQKHVALPSTKDVLRKLQHVLTATPRAAQGPVRAKLALDVPDLVDAGGALVVTAEIAEGEELPLKVHLKHSDGKRAKPPQSGAPTNGRFVARFGNLAPGDYFVCVEPGIRQPDVQPVWDLTTVIDPAAS